MKKLNDQARENLIILLGVGVQTLPYLLTQYLDVTLTRYNYPFYKQTLFMLLATIPLCSILELVVLIILVESFKFNRRQARHGIMKYTWTAFFSAVAIALFGYQALIAISWYYYTSAGFYIGYESLRLTPILFDHSFVIGMFSTTELILAVGTFILLVAITAGILFFAPARQLKDSIKYHGRGICFTILVIIAILIPQKGLHPIFYSIYRTNAFFTLSPQSSYFWAYARYGQIEPELPQVSMNLIMRHRNNNAAAQYNAGRNIFVFVIEGLRADAINARTTPTMHRLSKEGISFANAFSQSSETSESRLALITSRYPLKSRIRTRVQNHDSLIRVYDGLNKIGYQTGYIGEEWSNDTRITDSPHLNYRFNPFTSDLSDVEPADNPYTYEDRGLGNYSTAIADRLKITKLIEFFGRNQKNWQLTFALTYFFSSHFPYDQTDGVPPLHLPNSLEGEYGFLAYPSSLTTPMKNRYYNTLAYIDSLLSEFIKVLADQQQLSESIIIITGDHGEHFGEHGRVTHGKDLYQKAIHVPLIFWGMKKATIRWNKLLPVSHVDIAPTIYELVGLGEELSFQGKSIIHPAVDQTTEIRENRPVFLSVQGLVHEDAVIEWPWKIVKNHWGEGWRLFRLDIDPNESNNLFGIQDMRSRQLCSCLLAYRASQLAYYAPGTNLDTQYYPPRYDNCSKAIGNIGDTGNYCPFN